MFIFRRIILGRWDKLRGFDVFQEKFDACQELDFGPLESLWVYMVNLFEQFGLPIWVGSIPWALLFWLIGYHWSLRLIVKIRTRREQRRDRKMGSAKR